MRLSAEADAQRATLADSSIFLRSALLQNGFDIAGSDSQIVPVVLGSNEAALAFAENLRSRGYGIRAIRPPTVPEGAARLRLSLTSNISKDTLADLVGALIQVRDKISSARAVPSAQ
jgi:8-amino-7-oxononanoate synthase